MTEMLICCLFIVAGVLRGYSWGVEDTERRWSDAVARKADAERTTL